LKLKRDGQLSKFAFNFNLRRYSVEHVPEWCAVVREWPEMQCMAGAYARPLFGST
jgi:hypothetical protein